MDEPTYDERGLAALRALLAKHGPGAVFESIGALCADAARAGEEGCELWECAAEAAREAVAVLASEGEDDDENDSAPPDAEAADGESAPEAAHDPMAAVNDTTAIPPEAGPADRTETPKRTKMAKEDQLGPRPPVATHWRCRRIEEEGQKPTLLFHDDGSGIATCEWPIRTCSPEAIRQRWGTAGGAYVVQFIHADENGQRRPCGRSRVLHLIPAVPPKEEKAETSTTLAALPMAPHFAPPPSSTGSGSDDSFRQMLALLSYMQDRDEKSRAYAREEARISIERLRADNELQMERERLASKERLAQLELNAKAASKTVVGGAGIDADLLAHRIGEAVGAKLDEVYADDEDDAAPVPAPPAQPDALAKILEILQPLAQAAGPLIAQKLFEGGPPGAANPITPLRVIDGGNHGPQ